MMRLLDWIKGLFTEEAFADDGYRDLTFKRGTSVIEIRRVRNDEEGEYWSVTLIDNKVIRKARTFNFAEQAYRYANSLLGAA